jgi:hypothetical protein
VKFGVTALGPALICLNESAHPVPMWINAERIASVEPRGAGSALVVVGSGQILVAEDVSTVMQKLAAAHSAQKGTASRAVERQVRNDGQAVSAFTPPGALARSAGLI